MGLFDSVGSLFNPKPNKTDKLLKNTTKDIAGRIGSDVLNRPFTPYEGDWTAQNNAAQNTAMTSLNDVLAQYQQGTPQVADYMDSYFNPYLEKVGANTMRNMNELGAMRRNDLDAQRHMAGAYGDQMHGVAIGEDNRALYNEAGQRLDQIYAGGWDQALRAAGIDVNNEMQGRAGQVGAANALYQQGTQQQQTQQHQLDALFAEFMREQTDPERRMLLASQIMNMLQGGDAEKSDKGSELLGSLGTAASAATKIAGMFAGG